jgi:hypothetical protein
LLASSGTAYSDVAPDGAGNIIGAGIYKDAAPTALGATGFTAAVQKGCWKSLNQQPPRGKREMATGKNRRLDLD